MKKKLTISLILIFTLMLSSISFASVTGKLGDILVNESGLLNFLGKKAIKGVDAEKTVGYVTLALRSLNIAGNSTPSPRQLKQIIQGLGDSKQDIRIRNRLLKVLEKNSKNVSREELVEVINDLVFIAGRYGFKASVALACADCVSTSLARHGFKFTMETLKSKAAVKILKAQIEGKSPRGVVQFINSTMSELNLGKAYARGSIDIVGPADQRNLAIFLGMAKLAKKNPKELTKPELELINGIMAVVQKGSNGKLIDYKNKHKLYKLASLNMDDELKLEWAKLLRKTADDGGDVDAFERALRKRAADDPALNGQVDQLMKKNCYFKGK